MSNRSPNEDDAEVGRRIRLARKQHSLSQTDLGRALGVTYQQVQKYENGTDRIATSRLMQIARYLSVDPATLLPEAEGERQPLMTDAEIAALAAFRQIDNEAIQRAAIETLRSFAAASRGQGS